MFKPYTNNDLFARLGGILNPKNLDIEQTIVANDYAVDTLVNGNISECIAHLRLLISNGLPGIELVHDQLMKIKESCPERYEYVKLRVFSI